MSLYLPRDQRFETLCYVRTCVYCKRKYKEKRKVCKSVVILTAWAKTVKKSMNIKQGVGVWLLIIVVVNESYQIILALDRVEFLVLVIVLST